MDLTSLLALPISSLWSAVIYILPFLAVMTGIVFFHELGHFLVARWCGVRIEVFSIGFGREIFGWNDRHGTRWKVGWLPLGGYVKFEGDENAASMPAREAALKASPTSFHAKPLWQRALIVAAGPFANFLLAIFIFAANAMVVGVPVLEPVIDTVQAGTPADKAGFQPGDRVVAINGEKIDDFQDLRRIVSQSAGRELKVVVRRDGRDVELTVVPAEREVPDGLGGRVKVGLLGVQHNVAKDVSYRRKGPVEAVAYGAKQTWAILSGTVTYIRRMVVGEADTDQMAGPIRIAQYTSAAASISLAMLIQLAAVLSVSIGFVNLLPIPMLDGGHLLYYLIEAVRGRPLDQRAQELGFKLGMALVLALMLATTFNDILHLFSR